MSFIWPVMLILLLVIPLCVVLYLRMQRRRRRLIVSYGSLGLVQTAGRQLGTRRHIPPALFLAGLTILIIALARPQTVVSIPRVEGTVMLTFDVSGSMAAEDLQPNRMEAAKVAARAFVEQQPRSVQIGVLAFSDSGLAIQAPTNDQAAILAAINRLSPQRGTSLGQGILAALNTIATANQPPPRIYTNLTPTPAASPTPVPDGTYTSAAIVLLSDGADTGSQGATLNNAVNALLASHNSLNPVIFIPVAYGSDADINALNALARASNTKVQSGDPKSILGVLQIISSYF